MGLLDQQRLLQIKQPFILIVFFLWLLKTFHELFSRTQQSALQNVTKIPEIEQPVFNRRTRARGM